MPQYNRHNMHHWYLVSCIYRNTGERWINAGHRLKEKFAEAAIQKVVDHYRDVPGFLECVETTAMRLSVLDLTRKPFKGDRPVGNFAYVVDPKGKWHKLARKVSYSDQQIVLRRAAVGYELVWDQSGELASV